MVGFSCLNENTTSSLNRSPCCDRRARENGASLKTFNIIVGFFFMANYQLGTGFLGIPFAFFHEGVLAGTLTLVVVAFVSWNTAIWVLEVMARAQVCL